MTKEEAKLVLDSLATWKGEERMITAELVEAIKVLSQEPCPPKDLEEAAVEYSAIGYSPFDDPYEKNQQFECSKFAFIAGAKWQMKKDLSSINKSYESGVVFGMNAQKEQMMKEAVEGKIYGDIKDQEDEPYEIWAESYSLPKDKFHLHENVKLVIIKED